MNEKNKKEAIRKYSIIIAELLIAAFLGYLIALWQNNMEKEKVKIDLFVETKNICDTLQNDYEKLINAKIELEFFRVMLQNSRSTKTYSYSVMSG